jgi:uncharacterized membrane protein (DUF4010 family)
MMLLILAPAFWLLHTSDHSVDRADLLPANPLELRSALLFGALLAAVMLLGRALTEWFGDAGVLALAAASGVADVDAIPLSVAHMAEGELAVATAIFGIVIAAGVNSLFKAGMAIAIGGAEFGKWVIVPMCTATAVGLMVALR